MMQLKYHSTFKYELAIDSYSIDDKLRRMVRYIDLYLNLKISVTYKIEFIFYRSLSAINI